MSSQTFTQTMIVDLERYYPLHLQDAAIQLGYCRNRDDFHLLFNELKRYLFLSWRLGSLMALPESLEKLQSLFQSDRAEYQVFCQRYFYCSWLSVSYNDHHRDAIRYKQSNRRKFESFYEFYFKHTPLYLSDQTQELTLLPFQAKSA